jgi:hypothetical protein
VRGAHIYIAKGINFEHWTKGTSLIASQGTFVACPLIQFLSRYTSVSIAWVVHKTSSYDWFFGTCSGAEHNKWREREPRPFAAYSSSSYCPARSSKCLPVTTHATTPATLTAGLTSPDGGANSSALVTATRCTAGRNRVSFTVIKLIKEDFLSNITCTVGFSLILLSLIFKLLPPLIFLCYVWLFILFKILIQIYKIIWYNSKNVIKNHIKIYDFYKNILNKTNC